MAVMDAIGTALGVVTTLLGLLALTLPVWASRKFVQRWREAVHADRHWPRATGTITARSSLQRSGLPGWAYTFVAADGATHEGVDWEKVAVHPAPGRTLEVMYDPQHPATNHPAGKMAWRIGSWAVLFAVVIGLLYVLAGMLIWMGVDTIV